MKIWLVGGGTAGHILPLITLASEFKSRGHSNVTLVTNQSRMSKKLLGTYTGSKKYLIAGKFRRYHDRSWFSRIIDIKTFLLNVRDFFFVSFGFIQSIFVLLKNKPDVVFFNGGYIGVPLGMACRMLRINYVIHESDTKLGLANRILAPKAKYIAIAMPASSIKDIYPKAVITGIPLDESFYQPDSNLPKKMEINNKLPLVMVLGGSLGAKRINEAMLSIADALSKLCQVIHVTGTANYQSISLEVSKMSTSTRKNYHILDFVSEGMAALMKASQVVVSRAGATTIAELASTKTPTILIPNALLTGGHQIENAHQLLEIKAALVVQETENLPEDLMENISLLLGDKKLRQRMSSSIGKLAQPNSTKVIASLIEEARG